ncbi:hypothetical protein B0T25DRAFT_545562 [Lasiosphaeria hispida]|uniref:Uncharacterized protein n=1 Tax=Lasiosphaeria hispida TaxID=260671 RepID=A0AAJ0MEU9_9PEZI|nr:hypothetical protein B0T25DRAFT_545562 [Lasiosphaeria hispida]
MCVAQSLFCVAVGALANALLFVPLSRVVVPRFGSRQSGLSLHFQVGSSVCFAMRQAFMLVVIQLTCLATLHIFFGRHYVCVKWSSLAFT